MIFVGDKLCWCGRVCVWLLFCIAGFLVLSRAGVVCVLALVEVDVGLHGYGWLGKRCFIARAINQCCSVELRFGVDTHTPAVAQV